MKTVKTYQCECGEDFYEDDVNCLNCGKPIDKSKLKDEKVADIKYSKYEKLRRGYEEVQMVNSPIEKEHPEAYRLARRFHEFYEQSAPAFGYITNLNTREFYPNSNNGRLMAWVCFEIVKEEKQKVLKDILPHPRKLLGSVEKNDIWREGYNHCLWDIKQKINNILVDLDK